MARPRRKGTPAPGAPAQRCFLGWDGAPLEAAARWIGEHLDPRDGPGGPGLEDVLVALPGARAARRLEELCARTLPAGWAPPRFVTPGVLTDTLVRLEQPVAGRFARTLAWERALSRLAPERLHRLAPGLSGDGGEADLRGRIRLAETVRGLFAELAPEGLDFEKALRGPARPLITRTAGEAARWSALADAQAEYRRILGSIGVVDPHEGRLAAIEFGRVDPERRIVLVGVADMNRLLELLLERVAARLRVLVVAPEQLADGFDPWGRLVTGFWKDRDVPIGRECWHVVEKPVDQADRLARVIAAWDGQFAAEQVTIGVADEQVSPFLERRLGAAGLETRAAAGTPVEKTRPSRLLRAVARYLARKSYSDLAALAREADLGRDLLDHADASTVLDRYHVEHLPLHVPDRDEDRTRTIRAAARRLEERLAELATGGARPLSDWAAPVRALLLTAYGRRPLDPTVEADRVLAGALELVGAGLAEIEALPAELAGEPVHAAEAIELCLRGVSGSSVPPRAAVQAGDGRPSVELVGWLDLPLDDAPAVCVTGFNDGRVPASVRGHAFLPDGLRRELGLACDDDRLARDLYAATVMCSTRTEVAFVSGRRSLEGDPLVPSRLAFHVPPEELPARVRAFLPPPTRPEPAVQAEQPFVAEQRERLAGFELTRISVSGFRAFLESPRGFYLEQVLRLKTIDDRGRELDPLQFGIFVHELMRRFGEGEAKDARDAETIQAFLEAELETLLRERFGPQPLPAVLIQAEQLRFRLGLFAQGQAAWARAGWRIAYAEWKPAAGHRELMVDGRPVQVSGQIDRIDVNASTGAWAVLDYKSGESPRKPRDAHKKDGQWLDLQLPLYRWMAQELESELGVESEPELGYVMLGKNRKLVRIDSAQWDPSEVEEALEVAAGIVRGIRAGEFTGPTRRTPYEPILRALHGVGVFASEGEDEEEAPA